MFGRQVREQPNLSAIGEKVIAHSVDVVSWNGLNIKPALRHWKEQSVLGSVDESERVHPLRFRSPKSRSTIFLSSPTSICCVSPRLRSLEARPRGTFFPPYVPELNEYYGRELFYHYAQVRAEPPEIWRVVSLIVHNSQYDVTLRALPANELTVKLFERFDITAKPSYPGLVTSRLIAQMGGVQGCRVFKIEGVEDLSRSTHQIKLHP